ncbi:hypothetical protein ABT298_08275 [Streptomyces sp. NPDC001034]|uniref:hypothetical protein n=1 Tax=Streptomyces sp. NPDC001034 TaxID=3154375 RepID=UPI003319701B
MVGGCTTYRAGAGRSPPRTTPRHAPSEQAEERQQSYCTKLGVWQDTRDETAGSTGNVDANGQNVRSPESDNAYFDGHAAIAAAKLLHRKRLDHGGSHVLDDTVMVIGGDPGAERRAVSYCDDSGFETLVP